MLSLLKTNAMHLWAAELTATNRKNGDSTATSQSRPAAGAVKGNAAEQNSLTASTRPPGSVPRGPIRYVQFTIDDVDVVRPTSADAWQLAVL